MPVTIRSSSYVTTAGSSGTTVTLPFPSGVVAGDLCIVATTNNTVGVLAAGGWTQAIFADLFGQGIAYGTYYKVLDAGDISTGSVSFTIGLPLPAGNQIWAVCATNGAATVREFPFSHNAIGAGGPQGVTTSSAVTAFDIAVLFGGIVGNASAGVSPGTTLSSASAPVSGILAQDSTLSAGVNTFTFSGGGTHANFQVAVILNTGASPALSINCGSPPAGVIGSSYAHLFPASGGTAPYTFAIISGSLPPGLSLDTSTGSVTGIPTTQGGYTFRIQVTDSLSATAAVTCSITIATPGAWIIQEITAELIPRGPNDPDNPRFPGHYRYTVRCVDIAQAGTYLGFWEAFGGGGGGGGGTSTGGTPPGAPPSPPLGPEKIAKNGTVVGAEQEINFIEGLGINLGVVDDLVNGKVDVTINAHSIGGVLIKTANYTAVTADDGKLISFNSGSPVTLLLPAAAPNATWMIAVENIGAGVLTIDPNGRTLDGGGSITLNQNNGAFVFADGTNYWTERGSGGTITSIDMTVPPELTVSGVPSTGPAVNIVIGKSVETAHTFWGGPLSGSPAQPVFRVLDASDVPVAGAYQALAKFTASWTSQTLVTITHGFGSLAVIVQVYDASDNLIDGSNIIQIVDANNVQLSFGVAFTGRAVIIGTSRYSANSVYTTSWISQTSVTVTHNLSSVRVVIMVYDAAGIEAIPQSTTITSSNVVTLGFGVAFTGFVVVATSPALLVQPQAYTTSWVAQTSVTVTHSLGTTDVIVEVFDAGGVEAMAQQVNVTSTNVVTLTFGAAFTGSVTVIG